MNRTRKHIPFATILLSFLALLALFTLTSIASLGARTDATPQVGQLKAASIGEEVYVPAGQFLMGCAPDLEPNGCDGDSRPIHAVYLDAFYIDKTEVTNAQYQVCVTAGACLPPLSNSSLNRPHYYDNPIYADYPVVHIDWERAYAYCSWVGKRLPTEAEWEKAARGADMRAHPWGNEDPTCARANLFGCVGDTDAVGQRPGGASPYGALDMSGNVREWVNDFYASKYYKETLYYNPQGPIQGDKGEHLVRGGAWADNAGAMTTWVRLDESEIYHTYKIGIRCARSAGLGGTPTPTSTSTPAPTATPFAAQTLNSRGGAVWMTTDGHLTLIRVPPDVLSAATVMTVTFDDMPDPQGELQGTQHFFSISATTGGQSGYLPTALPVEAELILGYPASNATIKDTLTLYRFSGGQWITDDITITEYTPNYIAARITHPGLYGLLGATLRVYLPITLRSEP